MKCNGTKNSTQNKNYHWLKQYYNRRVTSLFLFGFLFTVPISILIRMRKDTSKEFTLEKIPELNKEGVHMRNRHDVEEKIKTLLNGGKEKLQIISDFDRTISKHHHNGELSKSSYCVYETIPTLPKSFLENAVALYKRFRVIEDDPNMTVEEKLPHMKEWWDLNEKLFIGLDYNEKAIDDAVAKANVVLRDGTKDVFDLLEKNEIPVLVFSAGLGNVVKSLMNYHNIYTKNVKVISNFFKHSDEKIIGFEGTLIHVYNKNEHAIENCGYFEELSHRPNIILMGDSIGDANMNEGVPREGIALKIGLLSVNIEEYLPQYMEHFDIVLTDDQTMNVFKAILAVLLN